SCGQKARSASRNPSCHLPPVKQAALQLGTERIDRDTADDVVGKGVSQQLPGLLLADAARLQIEDLFLIELANARSVRALDIIGVNLQLRLGVDHCIVRQQQRLVGLACVRLLGILVDVNLAVEDAAGPAIKDALVKLMAGAARLGVVDPRVIVNQLIAAGE